LQFDVVEVDHERFADGILIGDDFQCLDVLVDGDGDSLHFDNEKWNDENDDWNEERNDRRHQVIQTDELQEQFRPIEEFQHLPFDVIVSLLESCIHLQLVPYSKDVCVVTRVIRVFYAQWFVFFQKYLRFRQELDVRRVVLYHLPIQLLRDVVVIVETERVHWIARWIHRLNQF
jgi:hypothetical protein